MDVRPNALDEAEDEESGEVLVFVRLDDLRADADTGNLPRHAVAVLVGWGVRLILVSTAPAADVRQVQRRLRISEPFVCDGGGSLHVPPGCFRIGGSPPPIAEDEWDIIRFDPPNRMAAVVILRDLFVAQGADDVLTIGIGCDLEDYGLLAAVDLPIVVRDPARQQRELLRCLPSAYLTNAIGIAGWSEALIGP
jgi:hypothetical protein